MKCYMRKCDVKRLFSVVLLSLITAGYIHFSGNSNWSTAGAIGICVAVILILFWVVGDRGNECLAKPKSVSFDWSMHYFRAFAILCIVLLHFLIGLGHRRFAHSVLQTSTIFFLFISGYLCQYLHLKRPSTASVYYKKKVMNVILPYLVWTAITFGLIYLFKQDRFKVLAFTSLDGWKDVAKAFLFGTAQEQYWYIPLVSILFAISPLILRFSDKHLVMVLVASFLCSVIFPRRGFPFSISWPNFFYLYTHFTAYYLLGFVYCRFKNKLDEIVRDYALLALCFGIIIGILLYSPDLLGLELTAKPFACAIQKLCFTVAVIPMLMFLKTKRIGLLDHIANLSFTLYFIHMFFIQDFINAQKALSDHGVSGCFVDMALTIAFIFVILGLAILMKSALGKASRSIIGS